MDSDKLHFFSDAHTQHAMEATPMYLGKCHWHSAQTAVSWTHPTVEHVEPVEPFSETRKNKGPTGRTRKQEKM